jgi:hypothetical protein
MQLTFPSTADPVGRLVLERGAQAGSPLGKDPLKAGNLAAESLVAA